jgi:ribonuclease VapC
MIAVDTSALMAIVLKETTSSACAAALETETEVIISAATVAEALIAAGCKNVAAEMARLIEELNLIIEPLSSEGAYRAARAYAVWGKGIHPAALNFGDCFSYELAKENSCPLLFVGEDFAKTDIESVF